MRPESGLETVLWAGVRFEDGEYARRLARLREGMARDGFDAVVLSDDRLTWYLTGFGDVQPIGSAARPRVLVVPVGGDPTFLVHRSTERCVREMSAVDDVRVYRRLGHAPIREILELLREHECRRVGAELAGQLRPTASTSDLLQLRTGLGALEDCSGVIWELRSVKSEAEIERIRNACAVTDRAYARIWPSIRVGMSEREIAALVQRSLAEEGADAGWCWVASGRGEYNRVDGVPRSRTVEQGDLVFIDAGACVGGYWADVSRACVLGAPSSTQERMQARIAEVTALGVAALVPGRTTGDVALLVQAAMEERALDFSSGAERFGHGLGIAITEPPDIWPEDATPIRPGMVLTIEPGTVTDEGMFHCEQDVLVTQSGNELLSRADWHLVEAG